MLGSRPSTSSHDVVTISMSEFVWVMGDGVVPFVSLRIPTFALFP